jgi:hypothetical protein
VPSAPRVLKRSPQNKMMAGGLAAFKKRAYVLITVRPGYEASVVAEIERVPNVKLSDFVHGEYDVVCVLEGSYEEIDKGVLAIRKLPNVMKTITLTAFDTHLE